MEKCLQWSLGWHPCLVVLSEIQTEGCGPRNTQPPSASATLRPLLACPRGSKLTWGFLASPHIWPYSRKVATQKIPSKAPVNQDTWEAINRVVTWSQSLQLSIPRELLSVSFFFLRMKWVNTCNGIRTLNLVQFSRSVMSNSLRPHGLHRLPCPSPTPGACSNSCPSSQWCHPTSHPLLSPSSPAFNLSQHHGLFQWVSSSHQVAKVLEFQLQHQSFQWIFRIDFL